MAVVLQGGRQERIQITAAEAAITSAKTVAEERGRFLRPRPRISWVRNILDSHPEFKGQ
jgi:hypothetical protein